MFEKLKILIVEDDPASLIVSVKSFERRGAEVLVATDAYGALKIYSETCNLSAVITDIQLPGMDGTEMMHMMRAEEERKGVAVPIFAMTAYALGEDKDFFISQGFDDVFVKPVDYDKILKTVQFYT